MSGTVFGQDAIPMAMSIPQATSPDQSSPEAFEVEALNEDPQSAQSAHWQQSSTEGSQPRPSLPLQKRRRVTRACDECRRKKIKCDGKQPCTHCTVYSYDCTYDQPSNRRRNPAPQYIEALEIRLQRAETLLRTVLPNVNINDPNIDSLIQEWRQSGNVKDLQSKSADKAIPPADGSEKDTQLSSMIDATGQLDLDESGHWDFHGGSSGTVFVRRMREQFGGLLGGDTNAPLFPKIPRSSIFNPIFDSPRSDSQSPMECGLPNTEDLPTKAVAMSLCNDSLDRACSLLRFVHHPSFYVMVDRIYDTPPESFGESENRFLPFLYMVLALGCMFHSEPAEGEEDSGPNSYQAGIDQGLKYFRAGRNLVEITDCRHLTSLQTILFMILFLQSSANLSTCYAYIGVALRCALRMGLHRSLSGNFNPIERETRRRVFWVIRKMDTYVSALLGFPLMLGEEDIDQELPIEVDDEYITEDGVLPVPDGHISLVMAAANAHTALMHPLTKVIKHIYPTKGLEESVQGTKASSYAINHAKIKDIEQDLAQWLDKLPMALRPGGDGSPEVLRVQQLLRLSYAHVQMMLYRPFLHYVSQKSAAGKSVGERSYACAAACVSVSRNIVHITTEMKRRGLLVGAFWFTMYTTFFSILSLVYFILENPDKAGTSEILADANDGKAALDGLALRSQAADRCSYALRGLFEQLPARLKEHKPAPVVSRKKRAAPTPIAPPTNRAIKSNPELMAQPSPVLKLAPRALTFPTPAPMRPDNLPRSSLDGVRLPNNTLSNPNLRQSYHELMPQPDMSNVATPESSSTTSIQTPYMTQSQYSISNALPDLSAMMFPSADPFAYPNQPLMEYDNIKQEDNSFMNGSPTPQMIYQGGTGGRMYDDLEGQLFGPIPPYLQQGQQNYNMQPQMSGAGMMGGMDTNMSGYRTGMTPNNDEMTGNFDGIFSGEGDDWGNMLSDPMFRQ